MWSFFAIPMPPIVSYLHRRCRHTSRVSLPFRLLGASHGYPALLLWKHLKFQWDSHRSKQCHRWNQSRPPRWSCTVRVVWICQLQRLQRWFTRATVMVDQCAGMVVGGGGKRECENFRVNNIFLLYLWTILFGPLDNNERGAPFA